MAANQNYFYVTDLARELRLSERSVQRLLQMEGLARCGSMLAFDPASFAEVRGRLRTRLNRMAAVQSEVVLACIELRRETPEITYEHEISEILTLAKSLRLDDSEIAHLMTKRKIDRAALREMLRGGE